MTDRMDAFRSASDEETRRIDGSVKRGSMRHIVKAIKDDNLFLSWPVVVMVALCVFVWKTEGNMVFGWLAIYFMGISIATVIANAVINWRNEVWMKKWGADSAPGA